jgi:DMSO/TMAO reductase YedYZ molybdopterin-dependent catalytic subunit
MRQSGMIVSRRRVISGLAASGGLLLSGCSRLDPPTYGNLLRMGDRFTYRAQRLLLPQRALAREYTRTDITSVPAIGNTDPGNPDLPGFDTHNGPRYAQLRAGGFAEWRLQVEGSVARPASYSLADLRRFPARTQITKHTCEEGWSAICEWTGVPLRSVLEHAGMRASARYVNFFTFDQGADSIDMFDALHPQTLLAYGMNGRELPLAHGAPLRLRVEKQLGYKSQKFLHRIVVTDSFYDPGELGPIGAGWAWYVGI